MYPVYTEEKKSLDTKFLFTEPLQKTQLTLTGHTKPTSGHRREQLKGDRWR